MKDTDLDDLYFWFWKVPVDVSIAGLVPEGRVLRVRLVGMDEHCVRVQYLLEPPIDRGWEGRYPMCGWLLSGRDDLGTEYTDAGGAIGQSPDRQHTVGTRSLRPLPPDEATWLELAFHSIEAPPGTPPHWTVRIEIPAW